MKPKQGETAEEPPARITEFKAGVKPKPPGKKIGRPTKFTEALGNEIAHRLALGSSLRKICASEGMPHIDTVISWALDESHPFSVQYARARKIQAEGLVDEIIDIADDASRDYVTDDKGVHLDKEAIQRSKLKIQTRQWVGVKLLPKIYGDRLKLETDAVFVPLDQLQKQREQRKEDSKGKNVSYD